MIVREIEAGEESRWDEFVCSSPFSTPQHLFAWKRVMEDVFNSETHYLLAEDNRRITGVLPLLHIRSFIGGHYFTSLPGGICTDNPDAAEGLFIRARDFVKQYNAKYLILRDGRHKWELPEVKTDEAHVTFLIEIKPDLDEIRQAMKKRTRQLINQTSRNGLAINRGIEQLEDYYPIYAQAMRNLGTPTLGLTFFKKITVHSPGMIDLITLFRDGRVLGGGFISPFQQNVFCLWSGSLQKHYDLHISYFLTWAAIQYAYEQGFRWVDLGRCMKNSGGYKFKKTFGSQLQQLYQQTYMNGTGKPPSVGAAKAEDAKFRYFIKLWNHLPLGITEVIGPKLRKQMPFG
jgi:serine/alanine adding enzyme